MSERIKKMFVNGLMTAARGVDWFITGTIDWYHRPPPMERWMQRRRRARKIAALTSEVLIHDRS